MASLKFTRGPVEVHAPQLEHEAEVGLDVPEPLPRELRHAVVVGFEVPEVSGLRSVWPSGSELLNNVTVTKHAPGCAGMQLSIG